MAAPDPPALRSLTDRGDALRQRAAALRKRGADTAVADLLLVPLNAKMAYARASGEQKDYQKISDILARVSAELDDAERLLNEMLEEERERAEEISEAREEK